MLKTLEARRKKTFGDAVKSVGAEQAPYNLFNPLLERHGKLFLFFTHLDLLYFKQNSPTRR